MHRGRTHWAEKRAMETYRLCQLLEGGGEYPSREAMADAMDTKVSRIDTLVKTSRDPAVPLPPLGYVNGVWQTARQCPFLLEEYEKHAAVVVSGVNNGRANNLIEAHQEYPAQVLAIEASIRAERDAAISVLKEAVGWLPRGKVNRLRDNFVKRLEIGRRRLLPPEGGTA